MMASADTLPVRKSSMFWMMMFAGIGLTACSSWSFAECPGQWTHPTATTIPRIDGGVYASIAWDPDGAGPLPERLVIGGQFTAAGGVTVNNIAQWDGLLWTPLDTGVAGVVYALHVHGGELFVGGQITSAGGVPVNGIARWNGNSWSPLGTGVSGGTVPGVRALTTYDGELIVGGNFTDAGGVAANNVARWNGTSWLALGDGTSSRVNALAVHAGELIAGGTFPTAGSVTVNGIARWNGTSWGALAGGLGPSVRALAVYEGELIAGGQFISVGGVTLNNIARWDGSSWSALGSGVSGGTAAQVYALTVHDGELIVGGIFTDAGGVPVNNIAKWNGTTWNKVGSGLCTGEFDVVHTLAVCSGNLIAGGIFYKNDWDVQFKNIAQWDGSSWSALLSNSGLTSGPQGYAIVWAMTVFNGELIAAGYFGEAGGVPVNNIARWNGTSWSALGSGVSGGTAAQVYALTVHNGELIVGGTFTDAGGVSVNNIAKWDGTSWSALGTGLIGGGEYTYAYALTVHNGELITGGIFTDAGGVPVSNIAKWDGTSWSALGSGLSGSGEVTYACALAVYNGELIAGGAFTDSGGTVLNNIARWDGIGWTSLGAGLTGDGPWIYALKVHNGQLIAGGYFSQADGVPVNNIAAWDGAFWSALGTGLTAIDYVSVNALAVYDNELIAGGWFTTAGTEAVNSIARWNGTSWCSLGDGLEPDTEVWALAAFNEELHAAGDFADAIPGNWARWRGPGPTADFDCDLDVDVDDLMVFEACATGPAIPYNPAELPELEPGCTLVPDVNGHIAADFDEDNDVDQSDFGSFQRCYSGEGNPAEPNCAD